MSQQDLSGKLLSGRYQIEKLIARGGMASVYLATDTRLERQVAIKVIYQHLADDEEFKAKFLREAKMAAKLSHPNIVNIFDQGHDGEIIYLAMEYVPSITLRDALNKFGAIPPRRSLQLFASILEGLAEAHSKNVLHRDIKPENVFLSDDGKVKLGDFGLARQADSHTSTGSLLGTIAYLSPELITKGRADTRSDVYAAGIMFYEMLTGKQPFQGEQIAHIAHQHTSAQMPIPSQADSKIPAVLDELVLWATAREPQNRPANAQTLLDVVRRAQADLKAGKGATAKLDLGEYAKTSVIPSSFLPNPDATLLLNGLDETNDLSDLNLDATLDQTANSTSVIPTLDQVAAASDLEKFAHRSKIRSRIAIVLIPLLVVIAAIGGWWLNAGPAAITTIPKLENLSLTSAESTLATFDAKIAIEEKYSLDVAAGHIISSNPGAGSIFWRGSEITLVVSKGPELKKVPALLGLNVESATRSLEAAGFKLGEVAESYNAAALGAIYQYQGSDENPLALGTGIDVEISLGPIPVAAGLSLQATQAQIDAAGLKTAKTVTEFNDKIAKDFVIRIEPSTSPLRKGGSLTLYVSKGPNLVTMPNVKGETISAAQKLLEGLGLKVVIDTDSLESQFGITKVKSSSVKAGTKIKVGESVTISSRY